MDNLDEFTHAYVVCALWSTNDESDQSGGEPLDENYGVEDIDPETLARMVADCKQFQAEHRGEICSNLARAGHDFWLTRNGHGAGFWDGDWPEPQGERLTKASETFGKMWLYVGDDNKIYC
jgi:hypothetical protein